MERIEREALIVAKRVRGLLGRDDQPVSRVFDREKQAYRPITCRDIVVLLRSMRFKADPVVAALRAAGIPAHTESRTGFFESIELLHMVSLLEVLDNQRQDIPLAAVLRSPFAGLPHPEDALARVRLAYAAAEPRIPFHQAFLAYAEEKTDDLAKALRDFRDKLRAWREMAHRRPLAETIWAIYERTGYLAYVSGLPGGEQRVANLLDLHERAAQFGGFQRQGIGRFIQFLRELRAESDLGAPSIASEADDVVRVMSVHQSKGLEFPVVIIPDLGKAINQQQSNGSIVFDRHAGLGMASVDEGLRIRYPSFPQMLVRERLRRMTIAEELRVLYVAMTRAREHLILIGTQGEKKIAEWRERWKHHPGRIPADVVRSARTPLDWLAPVAFQPQGGGILDVRVREPSELRSPSEPAARSDKSPLLERVASLRPLDAPTPATSESRDVIERVTFRYPFGHIAAARAAISVTSTVPHESPHPPGEATLPPSGAARAGGFTAESLERPSFLVGERPISATERGTATHTVLEHLDWSKPLDPAELERQINLMIERQLFEPGHAAAVNREGVLWFAGTDLGKLHRDAGGGLMREVSVYLSASPLPGPTPEIPSSLDLPMMRGRIDALIQQPRKITLVDYKTDRVSTPEEVKARAAVYAPQLDRYRDAIRTILGAPIEIEAFLVFLTPMRVEPVR